MVARQISEARHVALPIAVKIDITVGAAQYDCPGIQVVIWQVVNSKWYLNTERMNHRSVYFMRRANNIGAIVFGGFATDHYIIG